jgi:hypothetical protein
LSHPKEHTHTLPSGPSEPPGHSFAKEAAQERVLHFIRDAYQVVNPHYQGSFRAHQQKIREQPNYFLPQRELMPDRVHAKLPGHAFDPDTICTRAGCFNIVLFRALLFGAEACVSCEFFNDLDEWIEFTKSAELAGKPESFWCNKRAYGPPISQRKMENAAGFWEQSAEWPAWVEANPEPTLDKLINFFKRFYSVSDLVAFVIAIDMVYAGFGAVESPKEMGNRIYDLNKGALAGLSYLGLFTPGQDREAAVKAFCDLYDYLDKHLTDAEKYAMKFDSFMLENTSCKIQRLAKVVEIS